MIPILLVISDDERNTLDELLVETQTGDKEALGEIYRIAGGRMLSVAMGLMRNKQLAEEVLHDSFIKVVRFCMQYKKGSNAYAWLCTIVRNTALNKIKSSNLKREISIDSFFNLSDEGIRSERLSEVLSIEAALKQLSDKERTVIWLKYYNDLTVREIAQEIGVAKSTVQDIVKTAEARLKNLLS